MFKLSSGYALLYSNFNYVFLMQAAAILVTYKRQLCVSNRSRSYIFAHR